MSEIGTNLERAKQILLEGGVIAFPTETVMGLGVVFDNFIAYQNLNKIKGRPEDKPYTMMVKDVDEISKYAYVSANAQKVINRFMPGPLTILLKSRDNVPNWVTHNTGIIGIRIPNHKVLLELLNKVEKPLLVPSANPSGEPPATNINQVLIYFNNLLDYIIEINSAGEKPSTIIDFTNEDPVIIREGSISHQQIIKEIKEN